MGVRLVPFPGPSSSGDQVLGEHTVPGGLCVLITFPAPAAGFSGCGVRAPSQVCCVSPLGGWSLAATQLADFNSPGSQEDLVSNLEPACNLVGDALWGRDCPLPSSSDWCLPPVGNWLVHSQLALLWYSFNPLFCEPARLYLRLELFRGKFSLSFLSLSAIPQFGLLSHFSSSRLFSGHSGLLLTLSMQLSPPLLADGRYERLSYFPTGSCG